MSNLSGRGQLTGIINQGSGGGTSDYDNLTNKPKINNVELTGNKTTSDLNISYDDLINKPTIRNVPDATGAEIGSVLTHTENGEVWAPVPKEIPPISSGNNGDVLTISNGSPVWSAGGGGYDNYSTTEHVVGTWIDGRTLYEKTYYLPTQTGSHMALDNTINMSNADVCFVTNFSYKFGNYINGLPMGYEIGLNSNEGVFIDFNHAISPFGSGLSEIYVTIRYVKAGE